jgi:hypothetical protein
MIDIKKPLKTRHISKFIMSVKNNITQYFLLLTFFIYVII